MVLEYIIGFVLLLLGAYIGCITALRDFFGRDYYDPRTGEPVESDDESED